MCVCVCVCVCSPGLAQLSLDQDFINERKAREQDEIHHVGEGVARGAESLAKGLWGGVSGLVYDPFKGAQEEGFSGFVKGLGKGVAGLVAKPTAGVVDFACSTFKGVGSTAGYFLDAKADAVHPLRPQRYLPSGKLTIYDVKEALIYNVTEKSYFGGVRAQMLSDLGVDVDELESKQGLVRGHSNSFALYRASSVSHAGGEEEDSDHVDHVAQEGQLGGEAIPEGNEPDDDDDDEEQAAVALGADAGVENEEQAAGKVTDTDPSANIE